MIRVAATAGMSASQAQKTYGISNLHKERGKVAQAVKECTAIRNAVDELVRAKEKAVLDSFGVTEASDSEEEMFDSDSDTDDASNMIMKRKTLMQKDVR